MELVSISHRPELSTPVLIQAVNGFPIVPMTLEGAIALVLKVDGIKNPCRFDILKRIQGKEKMKLPNTILLSGEDFENCLVDTHLANMFESLLRMVSKYLTVVYQE